MKYPVEAFEPEDILSLEKRLRGRVRRDTSFVYLTNAEDKVLEKMISEQEVDAADRASLLRAIAIWLSLNNQSRTVADRASLLAAAVSIGARDPGLGRRLVNMMRSGPLKLER